MQTILKVLRDNKSQVGIDDGFLTQLSTNSPNDVLSTSPSSDSCEVVFVRDDAYEFQDKGAKRQRSQLNSFGCSPNQANSKTIFIFMDPFIFPYRSNGKPESE